MENIQMWINILVSILTGLSICIPLIVKLVQYIQKAIKEKNWSTVMTLVLKLMTEAEKNYKTGAEKKQYVMDSIIAIKDTLNFDVDMDVIGDMINAICDASKQINMNQ